MRTCARAKPTEWLSFGEVRARGMNGAGDDEDTGGTIATRSRHGRAYPPGDAQDQRSSCVARRYSYPAHGRAASLHMCRHTTDGAAGAVRANQVDPRGGRGLGTRGERRGERERAGVGPVSRRLLSLSHARQRARGFSVAAPLLKARPRCSRRRLWRAAMRSGVGACAGGRGVWLARARALSRMRRNRTAHS